MNNRYLVMRITQERSSSCWPLRWLLCILSLRLRAISLVACCACDGTAFGRAFADARAHCFELCSRLARQCEMVEEWLLVEFELPRFD